MYVQHNLPSARLVGSSLFAWNVTNWSSPLDKLFFEKHYEANSQRLCWRVVDWSRSCHPRLVAKTARRTQPTKPPSLFTVLRESRTAWLDGCCFCCLVLSGVISRLEAETLCKLNVATSYLPMSASSSRADRKAKPWKKVSRPHAFDLQWVPHHGEYLQKQTNDDSNIFQNL